MGPPRAADDDRGRIPKAGPVVAIDGPAGAGKSTLARALAGRLGLPYVNTGLMYRALAERALERGIDPEDEAGLAEAAAGLRFALAPRPDSTPELRIEGRRPWRSLASPEVEATVSRVARHASVRAAMRGRQRALGAAGCVMEGRDIGTAVFPDADLKIFLSASAAVRVGRRRRERPGAGQDLAAAIAGRDEMDGRTNPLEPAPDAHLLDTTSMDRRQVLEAALALAEAVARARR